MKKIVSLFVSFAVLFTCSMPAYAQNAAPEGYFTLPRYNEVYSSQPAEEEFLSLQEYNDQYSHGESPLAGNAPLPLQESSPTRISPVKTKVANIVGNESGAIMGTVTLQYQTEIQGGRPQFVYDRRYLGNIQLNTYWNLDSSHVEFSGDRITVFFDFSYGAFTESAVAYFYPD